MRAKLQNAILEKTGVKVFNSTN